MRYFLLTEHICKTAPRHKKCLWSELFMLDCKSPQKEKQEITK